MDSKKKKKEEMKLEDIPESRYDNLIIKKDRDISLSTTEMVSVIRELII